MDDLIVWLSLLPVLGIFGSLLGGGNAAKAANKAAKKYIEYANQQRNLFLDQPESQAIRSKLGEYVPGDVGYSPEVLDSMKSGVIEDYGRTLRDTNRNIGKQAVMPGGGYSPGKKDRAGRLVAENLGARRAESMRGITKENADLALDNQRWATSTIPTYLPGFSETPNISYGVFQDRYAKGPSLAELGGNLLDLGIQGGLGYMAGGGFGGGMPMQTMAGFMGQGMGGGGGYGPFQQQGIDPRMRSIYGT